jgi:hypothetical protein
LLVRRCHSGIRRCHGGRRGGGLECSFEIPLLVEQRRRFAHHCCITAARNFGGQRSHCILFEQWSGVSMVRGIVWMVCSSRGSSAATVVVVVVGQCVAPPMSALATTLLVLGHGAMANEAVGGGGGGEWILLRFGITVEGHALPGHDLIQRYMFHFLSILCFQPEPCFLHEHTCWCVQVLVGCCDSDEVLSNRFDPFLSTDKRAR